MYLSMLLAHFFQHLATVLQNSDEVVCLFCTQHGDAGLTEVGDALEDGTGCEVTAGVEYAAVLIDAVRIDAELVFQQIDLFIQGEGTGCGIVIEYVTYLRDYPGTTECGPAHHDGIYAIAFKGRFGFLRGGDVAIADDGDMDARIALHLADERPVGFAGVHLCTGSAVDGECLYATVLQLFCQVGDDELFLIPSQTGLDGDGHLDGIYHLTGDFQHQRNVLEHAGTGALACHLLDRTTEVEVYHIWTCLFHYLGCLYHRLYIATVYLNAHRALLIADGELAHGALDGAHECLGAHKLGINHGGTVTLTEQTEADIGHIFHRCQKDWLGSKFYISYFHKL